MEEVKKAYNVEPIVRRMMPNMILLLGDKNPVWSRLNDNFREYLDEMRKDPAVIAGQTIVRDSTLYGVLKGTKVGNRSAAGMLDFFEELFTDLNNLLSDKQKTLVQEIVPRILQNINKDYLNFIGELATLRYFTKTEGFDLYDMEVPIPPTNNTNADFLMKEKLTGLPLLLEVQNLHLWKLKLSTPEEFSKHLHLKIGNKIRNKKIVSESNVIVQPVFWVENTQVDLLYELFVKGELKISGSNEPLVYAMMQGPVGDFIHKFERISTIYRN